MERMLRNEIGRFPYGSPDIERTDLFLRKARDGKLPAQTVLTQLRDRGQARAIIPVLANLREFDIYALADGPGKNLLADQGDGFVSEAVDSSPLRFKVSPDSQETDPLVRLSAITPDAVLVGLSGESGSELAVTLTSRFGRSGKRPPVFMIEDFPGYALARLVKDLEVTPKSLPDWIFVQNEFARRQNLKSYPSYPSEKIIITGHPGLDRFALELRKERRDMVREELGITGHKKMIAYIGTTEMYNSDKALELLVNGVLGSRLKDYIVVVKPHPADHTDLSSYMESTDKILGKVLYVLKKHKEPMSNILLETPQLSTDNIMSAADLIVCVGSTAGLEEYARKDAVPVINIIGEELIGDYPKIPIVEDGSSPGVQSPKQMIEVLNNIFFSKDYLEALKEKMVHWQTDGMSAQRVADFIRANIAV